MQARTSCCFAGRFPRLFCGVVLVAAIGCEHETSNARLDAGASDSGALLDTCVEVTGAGTEPWHDVQVIGDQFTSFEHARIRIMVGGGDRIGLAVTTITGGAFAVTIP